MKILVILGATASGKTHLAVQLAQAFDGEILSADSRQVYRGLDIGTGKDLHEYGSIPHHLIDVAEPGTAFNLFEFQQQCRALLPEIHARGRLPILVGGSGLYLEAIIQDYRLTPAQPDPELRRALQNLSDRELTARLLALQPNQHNTTDLESRERTIRAIEIAQATRSTVTDPTPSQRPTDPPEFLILGLRWERSILRQRIADRLQHRLEHGLIEEVQGLLARGIAADTLEALGLEYRFVTRFVRGELDRSGLFEPLVQAIRQFAKRQETWFRRMERQGILIHWIEGCGDPEREAWQIMERVWSPLALPSSRQSPSWRQSEREGFPHPVRTAPDIARQ